MDALPLRHTLSLCPKVAPDILPHAVHLLPKLSDVCFPLRLQPPNGCSKSGQRIVSLYERSMVLLERLEQEGRVQVAEWWLRRETFSTWTAGRASGVSASPMRQIIWQ